MSFAEQLLQRRRLALALVALLTASGVVSWMTMPRQEDPKLPDRWASVVVPLPGADAAAVERLVLGPVEDELGQVDGIARLTSVARSGAAILELELAGSVTDIDAAWDEVDEAIARSSKRMPDAALEPIVDTRVTDPESVVLAVVGSDDLLELAEAAELVRDELLMVPGVSRVVFPTDPGEQITVTLDRQASRALGLDARTLAGLLASRNSTIPGGTLRVQDQVLVVRPASEMASLGELAATPLLLPSGAAVALGDVATVERTPDDPASVRMRLDGRPAVGIAVVPRPGIDLVAWGEAVRERSALAAQTIAPLEIEEVAFQPAHVESRLAGLGLSLLLGILVVAGVLVVAMGPRLGLVVASVVPVVTFSSVALFTFGGGVLHQISIAALVLALGLLVDNAIVVVESVQQKLDEGLAPNEAAAKAVRELMMPLAAATGTTIAAFVPMLLAQGVTGDFTRSLPIVVLLTLALSYVVAVAVSPVVAARFLRPRPARPGHTGVASRVADRLAGLAVRRPIEVAVAAALIVGASALAAGGVGQEFFPPSDRATVMVTVELPEGAHLAATDGVAQALEGAVLAHPDVRRVATFVGRGAPRVYYNIPARLNAPHIAQLVVEATDREASERLVPWIRGVAARRLPEHRVVVERLQQGPVVGPPIQARLVGTDLDALAEASTRVGAVLRGLPGARDVRDDLGTGTPTLAVEISDVRAGRLGLSRADVSLALLGRTRGLDAGELRDGRSPVPIRVRTSQGESSSPDALATADVSSPTAPGFVPLLQVARTEVRWTPSSIHHHARRRAVTVSAGLDEGVAFSEVLEPLQAALEGMTLPAGVQVEYDGAARGSSEASGGMLAAVPVGVALLLFFLLVEFDSFRRVGIVMTTVPLAAAGVVPGLLIADQPFGFMSLLGVIALLGIVVNNAIVLIDVVDRQRAAGVPVDAAIAASLRLRTRPILLTVITTVAGLLPLALSSSSMWPPLAWAMISGLLASTGLTLLVVPSLYSLLFGESRWPVSRSSWARVMLRPRGRRLAVD